MSGLSYLSAHLSKEKSTFFEEILSLFSTVMRFYMWTPYFNFLVMWKILTASHCFSEPKEMFNFFQDMLCVNAEFPIECILAFTEKTLFMSNN